MITYNILNCFKVFVTSFIFDLLHSIFKCKDLISWTSYTVWILAYDYLIPDFTVTYNHWFHRPHLKQEISEHNLPRCLPNQLELTWNRMCNLLYDPLPVELRWVLRIWMTTKLKVRLIWLPRGFTFGIHDLINVKFNLKVLLKKECKKSLYLIMWQRW